MISLQDCTHGFEMQFWQKAKVWVPWQSRLGPLKQTFQGTHNLHCGIQVYEMCRGKETQTALLRTSLGRGLNLNRSIEPYITISKTWLLVLLVGFWQRRRMWQEWGPHCDCGQKCLRILQVFSALFSFCVM